MLSEAEPVVSVSEAEPVVSEAVAEAVVAEAEAEPSILSTITPIPVSDNKEDFVLDKVCWDIMDSYFETVPNYISKNQIDSYNMFLDELVGKTVRQFNPIQSVYDVDKNTRYEIDIVVGGSVATGTTDVVNDGSSIYIAKPMIHERRPIYNDDGTEGVETRNKQIYPNEARLKNLTYTLAIYCDIHFIYRVVDTSVSPPAVRSTRVKTIKERLLGRIPCMLQSKACVLSNIPRPNLRDFGECPYDHGGYFIIDGKEKVITAQTRQIENKIYTKKLKADEPYEYEAEIRSVPEDELQTARITRIHILRTKAKKSVDDIVHENLVEVSVPNIEKPLPLFVLFRALGITSDKEILHHICGNFEEEGSVAAAWSRHLYDNIVIAQHIRTQYDALTYIQNNIRSFYMKDSKSKEFYKRPLDMGGVTDEGTFVADKEDIDTYMNTIRRKNDTDFPYIYDILYNWLFPHVGTANLRDKAVFLGYMTRELLKTKWGLVELTDRDNYMYKRIDVSGFLIGLLFRDLYFRVKNQLTANVNTTYAKLDKQRRITEQNLSDLVTDENVTEFFTDEIMSDGFRYAFKNCWGMRDAPCKEGVVQDLARLTYLGMISHLRRVVTPLSSSSKLRGPHMLHLSTYGILCPIETPDGGNVGVKTNIALLTDVTFGTHSSSIYSALMDYGLIPLNALPLGLLLKEGVAVLLNGRVVGYHTNPAYLVRRLRLLRRNAYINVYTSVAWYVDSFEIKISTDSGRSCHPMLIVDDTKASRLAITREHVEQLQSHQINWYRLISSRANFTMNDGRYYREESISKKDEELEASAGVVEYIDTEELNTLLVAMNYYELMNNPLSKHTHCEIHPSVIFGIMGSIIPYVQTNQLPRNLYSCGQGKQAIGVYASNFRNRMDTKTQVLYYPQKPLVQNRISRHLYNNTLPYGMNAIIGIACYTGYNQDDSIIFNKSSVQRGLFRTIKYRTYAIREEKSELSGLQSRICNPLVKATAGSGYVIRGLKSGNYSKLDDMGMIREGEKVDENDIVCGKVIETLERDAEGNVVLIDASEFVRRTETGIVDKIFYSYDNAGNMFVKVRLRKEKIPMLGDKFASRAGQKGIMGMLLDEQNMPFSKSGLRPDMIINPQAFPKRMTISQFLETVQAKTGSLKGIFGDSSPFQTIPIEKMGDVLEGLGYERYGCEVLYNGMTGLPLEHEIFIGPTYYERLQHQVEDKMYSRSEGSVAMTTKQPTGGRAVGGGLRIGEMERDAILAHGVSGFLKETMCERSDVTNVTYCEGCGQIALSNPATGRYHCYNCNNTRVSYKNSRITKEQVESSKSDFANVQMPYAMKLFTQELEAMSIQPRVITDKGAKHWSRVNEFTAMTELETDVERLMRIEQERGDVYYVKKSSLVDKPFRAYQNFVKNILIGGASAFSSAVGHRPSIVDFSAGRGGDLLKWIKGDYQYVLALDIDENGLLHGDDCLKQRLENLRKSGKHSDWFRDSNVDIAVSDSCESMYNRSEKAGLGWILKNRGKHSFDAVSVQFSAHYCFSSSLKIDTFIQNIADSLREGGVAVMTTMDGEYLYSKLQSSASGSLSFDVDSEILYTVRLADTKSHKTRPMKNVGERILVRLPTTDREIEEYLVSCEYVLSVAKKHGLRPMKLAEVVSNFKYISSWKGRFMDIAKNDSFVATDDVRELFDNNAYLKLVEFADLYSYMILVKDTVGERVGFGSMEECESKHTGVIPLEVVSLEHFLKTLPPNRPSTTPSIAIQKPKTLPEDDANRIAEIVRKRAKSLYTILSASEIIDSIQAKSSGEHTFVYVSVKNGSLISFQPLLSFKDNTLGVIVCRKYDHFIQQIRAKRQMYPETSLEDIVSKNLWRISGCRLRTDGRWLEDILVEIMDMFMVLCKERTIHDTSMILYVCDGGLRKINYWKSPTSIDWMSGTERVTVGINGKCRENPYVKPSSVKEWAKRKPVAFFRGSSRGCETVPSLKNTRLRIVDYFGNYTLEGKQKVGGGNANFDVMLSELDTSDIIVDTDVYFNIRTIDFTNRNVAEVSNKVVPFEKYSDYKYLLCIEEYTNATPALGAYLQTGSLVIRVAKSADTLWLDDFNILQPYVIPPDFIETVAKLDVSHMRTCDYVYFNASYDLRILEAFVDWATRSENDETCSIIAKNGMKKASVYLSREGMLDYLAMVMNNDGQPRLHAGYHERQLGVGKEFVRSLEVPYGIAQIIRRNASRIEGYYDLKSLTVNIYTRQVSVKGAAICTENAFKFIQSVSNWFVEAVDVHAQSVNFMETLRDKNIIYNIENVFNVYLFLEDTTLFMFGEERNVDSASQYMKECIDRDRVVPLPWIPKGALRLVVERGDLEEVGLRDSVAVIAPLTAEYGLQYREDTLRFIETLFNRYGINFEIFNIKQRVTGVAKPMKDNPIGLLTVAGRIVPKEFTRFVVVDVSVELDERTFQKHIFRTLLLSSQEVVQIGNSFVFNGRRTLQELPEYLYGFGLSALPMILADMGTVMGSVYPSDKLSKTTVDGGYEAYRACRYQSIVRENARYFKVIGGNISEIDDDTENEHMADIEFLEEVVLLTHDTLPVIRDAISPYVCLQFYKEYLESTGVRNVSLTPIGKTKIKTMGVVKIQASQASKELINKATLYANLCKNILRVVYMVGELNFYVSASDSGTEVVVNAVLGKAGEEEEVSQKYHDIEAPYLPYYTVRNTLYIRDIRADDVSEFSEVIQQLKRDYVATLKNVPYPSHLGIFITRIADICFYYANDDVVMYDLQQKAVISKLPSPLSEDLTQDDLDLMLILFKDKNAGMLRILSETRYQNILGVTELTVVPRPKRNLALLKANTQALKNLLKLEPMIDDYDLTERSVRTEY